MIDPNGVGGTLSYFGTGDTFGIGQSTTHNDLAILINNSEQVGIQTAGTTLEEDFTVNGNMQLPNGNMVTWAALGGGNSQEVYIDGSHPLKRVIIGVDTTADDRYTFDEVGLNIKGTDPTNALSVNGAIDFTAGASAGNFSGSISYVENTDADPGDETVATFDRTKYMAAFLDYAVTDNTGAYPGGSNLRAGTITLITNIDKVSNTGETTFTDVSTVSIGDTNGVVFSAVDSGNNCSIQVSVPSNNWRVKGHLRLL